MTKGTVAFVALNRGMVSRLGLARQDVKRIALSAQIMTNWKPRVLGSMMIRPGTGYLWATQTSQAARHLPFVYAVGDTALLELTNLLMRVSINDVLLTRVAVGTAVTNGTFAGNIAGWTDGSDAGATAPVYVAVGQLQLQGNGTARSIAYQNLAIAVPDQGIEHALRIVIQNGPVILKVGNAVVDDRYVNQTTLETGTHSIAFTPTGAQATVQFLSPLKRTVRVSNCTIEAAGIVTLTTPWATANLGKVRTGGDQQSGDVLFCFCDGIQQRRIERRGTRPGARSWSVVLYRPENGPFLVQNVSPTTLTPSVLSGNGTLTASVPLFKSTHVGALFKIASAGQTVTANLVAANTFTSAIRVTGVGDERTFQETGTGITASGSTVTLQRSSVSSTGPWTDVAAGSAVDFDVPITDGLDNQIIWYRLGIKAGAYGGGTQVCTLTYAAGSIIGVGRVTAFTSSTVVDMEVLVEFGGLAASADWSESIWSDYRGWPSSGAFYEGRLWAGGKNGIIGSQPDAFDSFDDAVEGDGAPISRTIGSGPVDVINWVLPLQRMILGAEGAEHSVRSSSLDEPLTPTNFNIKPASTQGSANVQAVKLDKSGVFVQRGGTRVFELTLEATSFDYGSEHLSAIVPEIGRPGITRMAAQRQIDTVVQFVRSDGVIAALLFDKVEKVTCWYLTVSDGADGEIEDVCVLPGDSNDEEDQVYYTVKRTIGGATVRYVEKVALESECLGTGSSCKLADSHVVFTCPGPTTVITGLGHMEGEQVVVWADGADVGTLTDPDTGARTLIYTVAGGQITLAVAATVVVIVGLYYEAPWQSGKLLELKTQFGSALNKMETISGLGLVMADVHAQGLRYGNSFTSMQDLPKIEDGAPVGDDDVRVEYEGEMIEFPGDWGTDERLCLLASAPRPVTILAAVMDAQVNA